MTTICTTHTAIQAGRTIPAPCTEPHCPGCGTTLDQPSVSRYDHTTPICGHCGASEALAIAAGIELTGPAEVRGDNGVPGAANRQHDEMVLRLSRHDINSGYRELAA